MLTLKRNAQGFVDPIASSESLSAAESNAFMALYGRFIEYRTSHKRRSRVTITYSLSDGSEYSESGYVGCSTGEEPCLLLSHNVRSFGGSPIGNISSIVRIRESRYRGRALYVRHAP